MTILGLDYGEKRIGVAVSDETLIIARGVATIERKNRRKDTDALREIVERLGVEKIVVGYPLRLNGTEGAQCQKVRRFAGHLEKSLGTPVVLWDEALSTCTAEDIMRDRQTRTRRKTGTIDRVAASIILQEYLDALRKG